MKPQIVFAVLFFLLTFIALGTAIYVYLRKEQDKFIPKDKYDEAWNKVFRNKTKNPILNVHFVLNLGKSDSTSFSLGFGVISLLSLFFFLVHPDYFDSSFYFMVATLIGSVAALSGFFIGAFGSFRARNVSPLMSYGGVILCTVGLINIPIAIFMTFIFIVSHGTW